MIRFGGYNLWLSRAYKREFVTVIFVNNPTKITEIRTEQMHFKPIIVQCSDIDADAMLNDLQRDIAVDKPINELKLVYLPLFRSVKFSPTELFKESLKLIRELKIDEDDRKKIYALSIVLAGKIVDTSALKAAKEEVQKMGNVIIEVAEGWGREQKTEEIARKMLLMGMDALDIIEATGISSERLRELRDIIRNESVLA
jgi:hypothetical protein